MPWARAEDGFEELSMTAGLLIRLTLRWRGVSGKSDALPRSKMETNSSREPKHLAEPLLFSSLMK